MDKIICVIQPFSSSSQIFCVKEDERERMSFYRKNDGLASFLTTFAHDKNINNISIQVAGNAQMAEALRDEILEQESLNFSNSLNIEIGEI